jgi:hypothetical protein
MYIEIYTTSLSLNRSSSLEVHTHGPQSRLPAEPAAGITAYSTMRSTQENETPGFMEQKAYKVETWAKRWMKSGFACDEGVSVKMSMWRLLFVISGFLDWFGGGTDG